MPLNRQQGGSLMEALIALAILSFAVLGMIALQANVLRLGSQSQDRMEASLLSQNIAGMIAVDSSNAGCYALVASSSLTCSSVAAQALAQGWRAEVLANLPNAGEPSIAVAADRTATVTLSWRGPKDPATRNLVLVVQPL